MLPCGGLQTALPLGDLALCLFTRDAVALLNPADQDVAIAFGASEIVVGELPPLLLGVALELLPFTLNLIPVHVASPKTALCNRAKSIAFRTVLGRDPPDGIGHQGQCCSSACLWSTRAVARGPTS